MADETTSEIDPRIERTRRVVLDATVDIVSERGYDNTTIEGVSERCGVARSTIYRHWPSKQQLVIDAVKKRLVLDPDIDTGSVKTDIERFLNEMVTWFGDEEIITLALSLLMAAHRGTEVGRLHIEATKARRNHLVRIIERGKERGELPDDLDAADAVADLVGAIFYKRVVVSEPVSGEYVEKRTRRWLEQVGWRPKTH